MQDFKLQELQCLDAVVTHGGFEAAARALHRSHPAVFAAVAKLERQLGIVLLDRTGYRVRLTDAGRAFHARARGILQDMQGLRTFAAQLADGVESELRVVIGDFVPSGPVLQLLSAFFARHSQTRLHLSMEALGGPAERLHDGEADLILHGVNKRDPGLEWICLGRVRFVPVAAAGFLPHVSGDLRPEALRSFTQAVIRDTARHSTPQEHFVIEGAHQCTVPDHTAKKEVIVLGLAWGHLPHFLVEEELRNGTLVSLAGRHFPGSVEELVAARRNALSHGPVAQALWAEIAASADKLAVHG